MKKVLYIDAPRQAYGTDQIMFTMTVGDLIDYLAQFDEDERVYLKHDGGYTYGGITMSSFEEGTPDEEE